MKIGILDELLEDLERSPGFFYTRVCEVVRDKTRADLVWLGFVEKNGIIKPRAYSGKYFAYLKELKINLNDPELSRGPTGRALLEKKPVIEPDIQQSSSYAPWRERALYFGFQSSMAIPVIYCKETLGVINLYSLQKNYFSREKATALEKLAREVALILTIYTRFQRGEQERKTLARRIENLKQDLREKDLYLQHLEECKDRWLALLGHELRTPLTSILGFAEMLLSGLFGNLSEKQQRYLKHIKKNAEFILRILEELQKLARFKYLRETGTEIFSFEEVIERILFLLKEEINKRKISLKIDYPEKFKLIGNSHLLQEVIFNLLSNALKFSPEKGTVSIKVTREKDLRARGWMGVAILDQGPGVRPGEYYRIFKPFVQAGSFYTGKPSGLGLGLSLSREIVERQGGVLTILPSRRGGHFVFFWPETPITHPEKIEALLLEGRERTAHRMILWLIGEGLRTTVFPEPEALLNTLKEERGTFVLALDPWEYPREARSLLLRMEAENQALPTLFYRMEGERLKMALGANFVCLRPLNFPYLRKQQKQFLDIFQTPPTRVFLNAREHLASEARRLLSALDLELVSHPEEAEVAALDLGLPPQDIITALRHLSPKTPLFVNFSEANPRPPRIEEELPAEDFRREVARLLLVAKPEVSRTGSLV
ncbi:GAF domain-containing sensor histidine kinase [Thermosulfurimonas sp. F29]|uniref:sensor histidine kinase n=1 Tax=Thermosulfurimonas sp. F29 TaxID=2867247 RepID=UPI001C839B38|nr:GAF domain-containing sensor histidine kinase [Thermosulfurimonas sp. F29]MBX6423741.1 GAF domain-containing sensor histidine kinase [Thermosulfurimonas sp. F29]